MTHQPTTERRRVSYQQGKRSYPHRDDRRVGARDINLLHEVDQVQYNDLVRTGVLGEQSTLYLPRVYNAIRVQICTVLNRSCYIGCSLGTSTDHVRVGYGR